MVSQTTEYALRALVHLAGAGAESPPDGQSSGRRSGTDSSVTLQAEEIAEALDVPRNYLSKILHTLSREGILNSTRGPRGGFRLAAPAAELPLSRIVRVFEPHLLADEQRCLLGQTVCSDDDPCPAHEHWKGVSRAVRAFFATTTLDDLVEGRAETATFGHGNSPADG